MKIFQDGEGNTSSMRVMVAVTVAAGIAMFIMGAIQKEPATMERAGVLIIGALGLKMGQSLGGK